LTIIIVSICENVKPLLCIHYCVQVFSCYIWLILQYSIDYYWWRQMYFVIIIDILCGIIFVMTVFSIVYWYRVSWYSIVIIIIQYRVMMILSVLLLLKVVFIFLWSIGLTCWRGHLFTMTVLYYSIYCIRDISYIGIIAMPLFGDGILHSDFIILTVWYLFHLFIQVKCGCYGWPSVLVHCCTLLFR